MVRTAAAELSLRDPASSGVAGAASGR